MISRIDEKTALPLKILVPLLMFAIPATWFLSEKVNGVRAEVRAVRERLDGQWSTSDMQLWAARLQGKNPTLQVPEVGAVVKDRAQLERERERDWAKALAGTIQ